MSRGGTALGLKTLQWLIRSVQLLCAVIILAIYSYLLAALANHDLPTPTKVRAVEGIVGVAAAYALLGLLLLCCLAGRTLTAFVAMCLDFALLCAYIFVAVANKDGASSCTGDNVATVFGTGDAGDTLDAGKGFTKIPSYRSACKLETACLAIAIIAIFFYIFSIFVELALGRNHQREKRRANSQPPMQMPYAQGPYDNYQPGPYPPPEPPRRRRGLLGRLLNRDRDRQPLPQHDPNNLPQHAQPVDAANRDSQATAVGHEQDRGKCETGHDGPARNSPMVTGHTPAPATYTYTYAAAAGGDPYAHGGDSYAHAGDRFGHAGDDYLQYRPAVGGADAPPTTTTLPYPADDPYEPRRAEPPSHQMPAPRYPAPSYRYDDGIYDRP